MEPLLFDLLKRSFSPALSIDLDLDLDLDLCCSGDFSRLFTVASKDSVPSVFSRDLDFDLYLEHFSLDPSTESLSFFLSEDFDLDFDLDLGRSDDLDLLCLEFKVDSFFSTDFFLDL